MPRLLTFAEFLIKQVRCVTARTLPNKTMHPKPQLPIQPLSTDTSSVQFLLDFVQQRCRARTLTADDVVAFAVESEGLLRWGFGIPRRFLVGSVSRLAVPPLSKVYNEGRKSGSATGLMLERSRYGWRVLHVGREVCPRDGWPSNRKIRIILSPSAQNYLRKARPACTLPANPKSSSALQSAMWLGTIESVSAVC